MGNRFQAKMKEVIPTEKIFLSTDLQDDGYVAKCTVNGRQLITNPFPDNSYLAINHLITVVVGIKQKEGKVRDVDYIFTTKVK